MASYFESGFTVLKELAAEKQKQVDLEQLKDIYDEKFRVCENDKSCTMRLIDAYSDCD